MTVALIEIEASGASDIFAQARDLFTSKNRAATLSRLFGENMAATEPSPCRYGQHSAGTTLDIAGKPVKLAGWVVLSNDAPSPSAKNMLLRANGELTSLN